MPEYINPAIYINEVSNVNQAIVGVGTSTLGMLGLTEKGRSEICSVNSFQEYCTEYGGYLKDSYLTYAVEGFFLNGGKRCFIGRIKPARGNEIKAGDFINRGLSGFCDIDEINIVYVPDVHMLSETEANILTTAIKKHCEQMRDRFAIIDIQKSRQRSSSIEKPVDSSYAATYYPWIKVKDPLSNQPIVIPPGGHIAGVYARSDNNQGVHKAPANKIIKGVLEPESNLSKQQQDILNLKMINPIRQFPERGVFVWGARTCTSDPEWKYINVRRLIIYLEESITKGLQWIVFEPNDAQLWSRVRSCIEAFLYQLWRDKGLVGSKPEEAFFVRCDLSVMTQEDIAQGRFVCVIGVALQRPAEFIMLKIGLQAMESD
ncbi:MAG: phage tail sheath family protein [Desulfobacteraceae bacterium]|nr:phage tail sheath family protein [Desulfobacteraceae bacterium]